MQQAIKDIKHFVVFIITRKQQSNR